MESSETVEKRSAKLPAVVTFLALVRRRERGVSGGYFWWRAAFLAMEGGLS